MPGITPRIIRSHRRSISLQVNQDATVVVKAPLHISKHTIEDFITQHLSWIEQRLKLLEARPKIRKKTYTQGDVFLYLGKEVTLTIGNYAEITVRDDQLLFPQTLQFRIKKELSAWYIRQAREIITERVMRYAKEMDTNFTDLTFSDTSSQWGRCTVDNRLQFSWRLVMAPLLTINYVVVHELAHTVEKNHSRSFWAKVRLFNPSYRQQIQWLKIHGSSLVI